MAVPELECHQEEADTRLFLHAQHAASSGSAVVTIRSPDTDVAVIGCSFASQIPAQVLLHTGTKERRRYISLSSVAARLGNGVCQALPGLHAFTGCDSTSSFSSRGKKAAFKMLTAEKVDAMWLLGQDFEVSDELVVLCEQFVACLYNKPDVDEIKSFATNCSVPTQISHPVVRQPRMHCTGTFNVRTIKQPYGGGPSRSVLFRVQMAMGGKFLHQTMPLTQQQFLYLFRNGCLSLLPLNECWSLSPASARSV